MLEQRAPARISRCRCAVAGAFVQVGSACRAQSFAIIPALDVRGCRQEPGLSYRRTQIKRSRVRIEKKNLRIISFFGPQFGEKEVYILAHLDVDRLQAAPAGQLEAALHSASEIESSIARGRQPSSDPDRVSWTIVTLFPYWIVRLNGAVHLDGLRLQRAQVKRQHKPFKLAGL